MTRAERAAAARIETRRRHELATRLAAPHDGVVTYAMLHRAALTRGQVRSAIEAGRQVSPEVVVDACILPNVHPSVFPALTATTNVEHVRAVGVIETFTLVASIVAADLAVKAAPVELIEVRLPFAMGGKAFVVFTGEVSSVRSGVNSAVEQLKDEGVIDSFVVIPSPHKDLIEKLL